MPAFGRNRAYSPLLQPPPSGGGVHYSIQIAVWRFLVQMALDFHVQIFATTYSEDAIRAFSIATKENAAVDGRLIRLQSRGGEIEAVEFDEEELVGARDTGREIR